MTEGSRSKKETRLATDQAVDPSLRDPQYLAWMRQNYANLRRTVSGQRILYWSLAIGFAVGMASYVSGYFLRSSRPAEPFALLADLLYALGWALWTGVVVVLFVEVVPQVKKRQIREALDAYDAVVAERVRPEDEAERTRPGADRTSGGGGAPAEVAPRRQARR
jgi:hypothetical protein